MNLGPRLGSKPLDVLRHVLAGELIDGCALEFGVAAGVSTRLIADRLPTVGFDSFQGLPEDWRFGFSRGAFRKQYPRDLRNITLVEGWFADTLPGFVPPQRVALIHVDCDLYSSTLTVLDYAGAWLEPGVVVVFDEFHGYPSWEFHEAKAWGEFVQRTGIEWTPIGHGPEQLALVIDG